MQSVLITGLQMERDTLSHADSQEKASRWPSAAGTQIMGGRPKRLWQNFMFPTLDVALRPQNGADITLTFADMDRAGLLPGALVLNTTNLSYKLGFNYDPSTADIAKRHEVLDANIMCNFILARSAMPGMKQHMEEFRTQKTARIPLKDIASHKNITTDAYYLGSKESCNVIGSELIVNSSMDVQLFPI